MPISEFTPTGSDLIIPYGNSEFPTFASGSIVSGPVSIASLRLSDQTLGAVNVTNTSFPSLGYSGVVGFGFPNLLDDIIMSTLIIDNNGGLDSINRLNGTQVTDLFLANLPSDGPLLSRLIIHGRLRQPMFTVRLFRLFATKRGLTDAYQMTLQRESIVIGGEVGELTIGDLPNGVYNDSLTWVPVRLYQSGAQGGLASSSAIPDEVCPTDLYLK
jgi:hypothetical protein